MLDDRLSDTIKTKLGLDAKLTLFWQPKVSLFNGEITGAEALLRAVSPNGHILSPAIIIEQIKLCNLWVEIGYAIIDEVFDFANLLHSQHLKELILAFNLDAEQLIDTGLVEYIARRINETSVNPRLIEVELTESAIIQDIEHSVSVLKKLTDYGLRVAIDDFGTGYSSFSYVQQLPITTLKIDKSFIDNCPYNEKNVQIVKAIIQMSKALRFKTIAEGIENIEQAQFLDKAGCDEIQGWIFSKALPADEFVYKVIEHQTLDICTERQDTRKLMIVDDEPHILSALSRTLRREGYTIKTSNSAHDALTLLSEFKPDVILSDQRMPNMTGVEFFRQVKNINPEAIRIILSGYTELESVTSAINDGAVWKFLTKPWDDDNLKAILKDAFVTKEIKDENRMLASKLEAANHELKSLNSQLNTLLEENEKRNRILEKQLLGYQHIIDAFPIPSIGVSEGLIVLANAASKLLFEQPLLMTNIEDLFAADASSLIINKNEYTLSRTVLPGEHTCIIGFNRKVLK